MLLSSRLQDRVHVYTSRRLLINSVSTDATPKFTVIFSHSASVY